MINKLAREWINELKSGRYKKTTGELRAPKNKSYGYCCLGVACKLLPGQWDSETVFKCQPDGQDAEFSRGNLSGTTRNLLGLTEEGMDALIKLNDEEGYTLPQIGKEMETNPEKYFQVPKKKKSKKASKK